MNGAAVAVILSMLALLPMYFIMLNRATGISF
jgi:hypothetical protein